MALNKLNLPKSGVVAVIDTQWGDTGKGKFVDLLTEWADITARGTGGANAGHTIVVGDETHIFHLVPSGILWDKKGKINIIGNGVAFDPRVMCEEIKLLDDLGQSHDNIKIAYNAHLVLPQHVVMDRIREQSAGETKIGTTGRGIGPLYADFVSRCGLSVSDMLNPEMLKNKLLKNLAPKIKFLKTIDKEIVKEVMKHEHLDNGAFWDEENIFNVEAIMSTYLAYGEQLKSMIGDTDTFLRDAVKKGDKKILLEGAQGTLLSIDHGIYPFVTSSDSSAAGLAKGVGIGERDIHKTYGIAKAFYMTRVGEGIFPTELGGTDSAEWCGGSGATKSSEAEKYPNADVNSEDSFEQGVGIRIVGHEYGATTGRPRRTGWFDLPLLRYTLPYGGDELILTKVDVLNDSKVINICTGYIYDGPDFDLGERVLKKGDKVDVALPYDDVMSHMTPVYEEFPGWESDVSIITDADELPEKMKNIIKFVEKAVGVRVAIVSVGPDRGETVVM